MSLHARDLAGARLRSTEILAERRRPTVVGPDQYRFPGESLPVVLDCQHVSLATTAFDPPTAIDRGTSLVWGMEGEGNHFFRGESFAPVTPTFVILGGDYIYVIPEPTTALRVMAGVLALAVVRRRRG